MARAAQVWSSTSFPDVVVFAGDRVPILERERFAGAVGRLLERRNITGGARLRVAVPNTGARSSVIQVNLTIGGRPARVQTETGGPGDALPVVVRLQLQIEAMRAPWRPRPWPDPTRAPIDRPGPGQLVRRKSVTPARISARAAAEVMDAMDYDAHLFIDADTGEDTVVYRGGPWGLRLTRQRNPGPPTVHAPSDDSSRALVPDPRPAPSLTETRAAEQVREHGLPFLFYTDPASGRGRLLYRRYDADLTLIEPVATVSRIGAAQSR
ncbi:sigma 54 modulation/S30EA ribosomal C-terminal domain-containing protein [Nocardia arizonensis]|uniref:sigma 54 modulation/S30EA ribosomal C-terminal domain-containing protein n=1 Tax=Nocardia arizonensis TaxID=1141647 RepID=UPI0006D24CCD|nr:sigma 54 modulation/S30EA ribosomal C-terminal domain-containing protein [Nocardia arizonensis]